MAKVIVESAMRGRFLVTPDEWQRGYIGPITVQVNGVMASWSRSGVRPPQPPASATSPLVNNPAGVSLNLGKHNLRQEDLHIPDSKRRRSTAPGMSASPSSTADPASVPPISQTPQTMGTPTTHPMSTPSALQAASKRPSTGSPSAGSLPPNKMQIGPGGVPRDRAVDEAIQKRHAKERAEEIEREEARKDPLEYVKNAMYKAVGTKKSDQPGVATFPAPMVIGLADQIRLSSESSTSGTPSPNGVNRKSLPGQRAQLPSPPWSGTITPRQLSETFVNTTDIEFAISSMFLVKQEADDLNGFSVTDMLVSGDDEAEENHVKEELSDLDFLSPLGGESGWDDAYSWTKNLHIPWNGDISHIFDQANNLGVAA